jgi:hypothetical protein
MSPQPGRGYRHHRGGVTQQGNGYSLLERIGTVRHEPRKEHDGNIKAVGRSMLAVGE